MTIHNSSEWAMPIERDETRHEAASASRFVTTHWSVVIAAREGLANNADAALERLCRTYWWPLYAFVRRRGHAAHDAQDLTQEFFAGLLAKDFLCTVDRSKGKFRSFLLAALDNFLAKEWRRANAQKRGGGVKFMPLDGDTTEQHYLQVVSPVLSPEQTFLKQWAIVLLEQVISQLREEFLAAGKETEFERLKVFLTGDKRAASYAELAVQMGTTEAALKMAVSRMRQRYGQLLRGEIANTVSNLAEVDEELRAVFAALSL
jgi:RNA polymerase sigma-70 factor (ECF subfamily)